MGLMVDANVFIQFERQKLSVDLGGVHGTDSE